MWHRVFKEFLSEEQDVLIFRVEELILKSKMEAELSSETSPNYLLVYVAL
jgi:hypothetical protein